MTDIIEDGDIIDISVDIETLATTPDAVVFEIAACTESSEILLILDMVDQLNVRRVVDGNTLQWHVRDHAPLFLNQLVACERDGDSVDFVLDQLGIWFSEITDVEDSEINVWMKSPSFDGVILRNLAGQFGLTVPWNYREERDFRTLAALTKEKNPTEFDMVPTKPTMSHSALTDARYQYNLISRYKTIIG